MSAVDRHLVATAVAPLDEAGVAALFEHLVAHMEEADAAFERLAPGHVLLRHGDSSIAMERAGDGLRFRIEAGDERDLQMWREGAVEHVAEEAPAAAAAMRWSDARAREGTTPGSFREATVATTHEILPGLLRVELALDAPLGPGGIHLRLLVPPPGRAPTWPVLGPNGAPDWPVGEDALHARAYTIRRTAEGGRRVTLDVVRHAGGRVARWAEAARPGDVAGLMGPSGGDEAPATDGDLVVAGDMTALPAMARLLEALPASVRVRARAACPSQGDADAYFGAGRVTAVAPEAFDASIVDALGAEPAPDSAWFAGEIGTARALRRLFRDRWSLGPRRRLAAGYWERTG